MLYVDYQFEANESGILFDKELKLESIMTQGLKLFDTFTLVQTVEGRIMLRKIDHPKAER